MRRERERGGGGGVRVFIPEIQGAMESWLQTSRENQPHSLHRKWVCTKHTTGVHGQHLMIWLASNRPFCVLHLGANLAAPQRINLKAHIEIESRGVHLSVLFHDWSLITRQNSRWKSCTVCAEDLECTQSLIQEWLGRVFWHATWCHCAMSIVTMFQVFGQKIWRTKGC